MSKGDPKKLPCSSCRRTRPPHPNDEVKTFRCNDCGYSLPACADARDPRHTVLLAERARLAAQNALVSVPGAIVDQMLDGRNELITQLRECLEEWFSEKHQASVTDGMIRRARAALKAAERWKRGALP